MNSENQLVPADHHATHAVESGELVIAPGESLPWVAGTPQPEILQRGIDPWWVLQSFRRRWVLATGLGLAVGLLVTALVWLVTPSQATAVVLLKVASRKPVLLSNVDDSADADFLTFKRTQTELLKSHFVLQAALGRPGVSTLPSVRDEADKIDWMRNNLDVTYPGNAEVLRIAMEGEDPAEVKKFVEATTEAYMSEVVYKERDARLNTRASLEKAHQKLEDEIRRKTQFYNQAVHDRGAFESQAVQVDRSINLDEMNMLRRQRIETMDAIQTEDVKIALLKERRDDPLVLAARVDELVAADPQIGAIRQQIQSIELAIIEEQSRAKRQDAPSVSRLSERRNALAQSLTERESSLRPQLSFMLANTPQAAEQSELSGAQLRKQLLSQKLEQTNKDIDRLTVDIKKQGEESADLMEDKAELDRLRSVAANMGNRIEAWTVELESPQRVTKLQNEATIIAGIDSMQRYLLVSLGGMFGFGLTALGVSLWDFRARKLNDPTQVDEGLGIQVLGELPPIAGPADASLSGDLVNTLTECIDGVRTRLLHLARLQKVQSIMVTSATGQEGASTVASQLAASLAPAGKRTLLVDGDLRHPELHRYFDLPAGDGLAEALSGSVPIASVLRATESKYLTVLTAGEYDAAAMQALAQEQLAPLLKELAQDFDFIIIDAAPVMHLTDALLIGRQTDGAILATRRDVSTVPLIHAARSRLRSVGVRVLGAVVNGVKRPHDQRSSRMRLMLTAQESTAEKEVVAEVE